MSVPRLEHLACVVVDIDEFLTKAGVNVWYELTKQIFLKAGYTLEQAMVAVEKHKQIYGKFRDRVSNLDPIKDHAEYEAAYTEMVTGIKSLYESSGLELTRENLADCVKKVIDENIVSYPEVKEFLDFLEELREIKIPIIVLTGAYSLIAEILVDQHNFVGSSAASEFNWLGELFDGFKYISKESWSKVQGLLKLSQSMRTFVGWPENEIIVFDDGKTASGIFEQAHGVQLLHPDGAPLKTAKFIGYSLYELQAYTESILPQ